MVQVLATRRAQETQQILQTEVCGSFKSDLFIGNDISAISDGAVSLIREAPQRWRVIEADVRRYLMTNSHEAAYPCCHFGAATILTTTLGVNNQ
jgi:hypothetical protein